MLKENIIVTVCIVVTLGILLLVAVTDKTTNEKASMEARVELLEKQMKQKIRPIIQINRASVYNTDGEVVIEDLRIKAKGERTKGK